MDVIERPCCQRSKPRSHLSVYLFDFTSSDVITGFTSSDQTRFWTEMGLGLGLGLAREILIK